MIYSKITLKNSFEGDYIQGAVSLFDEFVNASRKIDCNVALTGGVGTGKTALCHAFMNDIVEKYSENPKFTVIKGVNSVWLYNPKTQKEWRVKMFSMKKIIDDIKANFRSKDNTTKKDCLETDVLIIDEIGLQYGTDMERIELFDIIDYRCTEGKPTIITSNFTQAQLEDKLGQRISDRLFGGAVVFHFTEKSRRR